MVETAQSHIDDGHGLGTRRDFLTLNVGALGAAGATVAVGPFIDSLNPARDTVAMATTDVDLSPIQAGQRLTVVRRSKPVIIDHRTPADNRGPYGGRFRPCHGSVYDASARIRQGSAPLNLEVPPCTFTSVTAIKIG